MSLEWNSPLYISFIDYEKAFESVDRETMWKLLRHYGVPEKIIFLIQCTYQDMSCRIAHAGQLPDSFEMKTEHLGIWRISMRTKLSIFSSNVKSVLLYGCETWWTTRTMQQKIQTFLNICLRRICKIQWQEKIRNEDLWERAGQEPVAKQYCGGSGAGSDTPSGSQHPALPQTLALHAKP